jgi:putative chitinase
VDSLNAHALGYGITTPARLAMLLAQAGHESMGFTRWSESLLYSADRLLVIFPRQFTTHAEAKSYAKRGPVAIAGKVYAGRLGNGDESSGDGWRFRGRGPIQLTGRANYERYGRIIGADLILEPALAAQVDEGVEIACAYFMHAGCLAYADRGDVSGCTRAVNGGQTGLLDRTRRWEDAKRVLGVAA